MSEQLANRYSATLASPYTSGSGSIVVSSASGAPSTGTFTLAIFTGSPLTFLLLFRVTSVSGTTFNGAAEGPDTSAPSGATVLGTILSAAAIAQIESDAGGGGGGFIQALTAPVHGNFTQLNFNVGSGVVTTETDISSPAVAITIRQQDPSHTGNTVALKKSPIAATFTVTIAVSVAGDNSAGAIEGIFLSDGSSAGIFFGPYQLSNLIAFAFTSLTNSGSGGSTIFNNTDFIGVIGPLIWLRIQETASARNYYVSSDGVTFYLVFTESNTAHFTTAAYGFGMFWFGGGGRTYDGGITCYSFAETNP